MIRFLSVAPEDIVWGNGEQSGKTEGGIVVGTRCFDIILIYSEILYI